MTPSAGVLRGGVVVRAAVRPEILDQQAVSDVATKAVDEQAVAVNKNGDERLSSPAKKKRKKKK